MELIFRDFEILKVLHNYEAIVSLVQQLNNLVKVLGKNFATSSISYDSNSFF